MKINKPLYAVKYVSGSKVLSILFIVTLSFVYFAAGKLSLNFAYLNQSASPFWLPTGISIAAFLLYGFRIWPAIFIGAFFVNITTSGTFTTAMGIAAGNTLEGISALFLIKRFIGKNIFDSPFNILKYVLFAGIISTIISAVIGINSLYVSGLIQPDDFFPVFITWWLGDMGGALIITPVLYLWATDYKIDWNVKKTIEALIIFFLLIVTSAIIFMNPALINLKLPLIVERYPYPFMIFPLILLIAFRFGLRETATAIFIFTLIALIGIANGSNRMALGDPHLSLINLQIFAGFIFLLKMSIAAAANMQRKLEESLQIKVEQQAAVSDLGLSTLSGMSLPEIMKSSAQLLQNILDIDYCKILKLLPGEKELLLIEGIGWKEGYVGKVTEGSDLNSPAGFTLFSKEPVIVSDLRDEKRFNIPPLLSEHDIVSGMSCIIYGKEKPFGVLSVYTETMREFSNDDIDFLQSVANIIAMSIERSDNEEKILSSLEEKQILLKEIHHRVKNNMQIISSLLSLQAANLVQDNFKEFFIKSRNRVKSMALVHEMLYSNENLSKINFKNYINELAAMLRKSYEEVNVRFNIDAANVFFNTDLTINLGLIINEIITNSIKHAFKGKNVGTISIILSSENSHYNLSIKDNGIGLPPSIDINNNGTLGLQLITSLVKQMEGSLDIRNNNGTEFIIIFKPNKII